MYKFILLFVSALSLVGCGNEESSSKAGAPVRPAGSVSGYVVDALIKNGDVEIYSYSGGVKGATLGTGSTDTEGAYSVQIQSDDQPILIRIKSGYYNEEASGKRVDVTSTTVLDAVIHYASGQNISASITPFTNLAVGLIKYKTSIGTNVDLAILQSNFEISSLLGVDILATTPLDITDPTSASASLTPEHKYGFILAGISQLTRSIAEKHGATVHLSPYTSIEFAQVMQNDIAHDGKLNGIGTNVSGAEISLSYGAEPMTTAGYRHGIALGTANITNSAYNKTSLSFDDLIVDILAFNDNFSTIYAGDTVVTLDEGGPIISLNTLAMADVNNWYNGVINHTALITDVLGVNNGAVQIYVNDIFDSNAALNTNWDYTFDTTMHADGFKTIRIDVTNIFGTTNSYEYNLGFDNTKVRTCVNYVYSGSYKQYRGTWSDISGSGVAQFSSNAGSSFTTNADGVSGTFVVNFYPPGVPVVTDNAGNTRTFGPLSYFC